MKAWCREEGLSAWDRRSQMGLLRNLVVREGRRTGQLQARVVTSPGVHFRADELAAATPADAFLWTRAASVAETTRGGETERLKGPAALEEELCGLRFRISPDAFFQTNTEMAERLYGAAVELAGLSGRERVLDLFCGIGTIALVLALDAGEVYGVELVEEAVADAIENARLNGVDNAHFFAGDVRTAMRPLLERSGRPDVVVVDPPRAGLSKKVVRRVLEAEAQRIVYVSCNPTTLAPERPPDGRRGLRAPNGATGGHVPADPAHRVRGPAERTASRPARLPRRARPLVAWTVQRNGPPARARPRSPACQRRAALAQVRSITGRLRSSQVHRVRAFLSLPITCVTGRPVAALPYEEGRPAATSRCSAAGWRRSSRRSRGSCTRP